MIKVIVCDLDGTLLDVDHRINHKTAEMVRRACAAGMRFMIATGREFNDAIDGFDGEEIPCDYILSSGAEIRNPKQEVIFCKNMNSEYCKEA